MPATSFRLRACLSCALLSLPLFAVTAALGQSSSTGTGTTTTTNSNTRITTTISNSDERPVVHYNNPWEIYGGVGYDRLSTGPALHRGFPFGSWDVVGTRWLTPRLGVSAEGRGDYGTTDVNPNIYGIKSPRVSQLLFLGGVQYRAVRSQRYAVTYDALVGGARGTFDTAIKPLTITQAGLYPNQTNVAAVFGGSFDYNHSPRIVYRFKPEGVMTRYGGSTQVNFAVSIGVAYKFGVH